MLKYLVKKILWEISGGYKPRNFWNNWAKTFMEDPWQTRIHKQHEWLINNITNENPSNILEVGCGFGRNIKFLLENGVTASITGIDLSRSMIANAKNYLDNSKVKLITGDINNLPFKNNSYDLVFTHGVLMHVKSNVVEKAIAELLRVSKKKVILIEQNYGGNNYTFIHDYRKILKKMELTVEIYKSDKKLGLDLIKIKK